jgi:hypothetical protein
MAENGERWRRKTENGEGRRERRKKDGEMTKNGEGRRERMERNERAVKNDERR